MKIIKNLLKYFLWLIPATILAQTNVQYIPVMATTGGVVVAPLPLTIDGYITTNDVRYLSAITNNQSVATIGQITSSNSIMTSTSTLAISVGDYTEGPAVFLSTNPIIQASLGIGDNIAISAYSNQIIIETTEPLWTFEEFNVYWKNNLIISNGYLYSGGKIVDLIDPCKPTVQLTSAPTVTVSRADGAYLSLNLTNNAVLEFDIDSYPTNYQTTVGLTLNIDSYTITRGDGIDSNTWDELDIPASTDVDLVFRMVGTQRVFKVRQ